MQALPQFIYLPSLNSVIDFSPLTVAPETAVLDAVALMASSAKGYVLVKSTTLVIVGCFTEQDLVRLLSGSIDLKTARISDVMNTITTKLKLSEFENITTALSLLRQHQSGLLLVVDEEERLIGAITHKSICQVLEQQPEDPGRLTQELFHQLADNIHEIFFVRDPKENKLIYISPAYEKIWGRSRDKLPENPQDFLEAIHPEDRDRVLTGIANQALGKLYNEEYRIFRPDGEVRWIWTRGFPVKNELGEIYRIIGIAKDITERKLATEALRESEERFRIMADTAPVLIWMADTNRLCTFFNKAWLDFTGRTLELELGNGWAQGIHFQDVERCLEIYLSAFGLCESFSMEFRLMRADGEYRWLLNTGAPRFTSEGNFAGYIGSCIDISERKEVQAALLCANEELEMRVAQRTNALSYANEQLMSEISDRQLVEEQLRQSQEKLQLIMDSIPHSIFWKDKYSIYLGCNRNFALAAGLKNPEDIVGKSDYDLYCDAQEADFNRKWDVLVMHRNAAEYHIISPHLQRNGKQTWVETNKVPLHDARGNVVGILGTSEDITVRKLAQLAIKDSEQRFRNLVETSSDLVWEADENSVYTYVSPHIRDILGYECQEVVGKTPYDFMSPKESERIASTFALIAPQQEPFKCLENSNIHKNGHEVVLETSGVAVFDAQGKFRGYRGVARDITDRKLTEQNLRLRDRAIAAIKNGVIICDALMPDFPVIYVNTAFESITGYSVAEVMGRNCRFIQGGDRHQPALKKLKAAIQQGKHCTVILRNYRQDGTLFWNELSVSPVFDAGGNFTHCIGIIADITERKQAETALLVTQKRLQYLVSSSPGVIYTCNIGEDCATTFITENVALMLGYEAREFTEDPGFWLKCIHPEDAPQMLAELENVLHKDLHNREYRFLHQDGSYRWVYDQAKIVRDDAGNPVEIVGYWADISDRKQLEEELRTALEKEKELNELKSRFVSMTSHEFRTPLSTILSSSELLEHYWHKWTQDKQLIHLHRIQTAVKHMTEMLNDVLVIGKAEAGRLEFRPTYFDLVEYCNHLVQEVRLNLNNEQIVDFSSLHEATPCCMDKKLLAHILSNLLSNAIKYSPDNSTVKFTLACVDGEAIFSIQDRGIGIPQQDIPHLFESFHRANNVGNIEGTGLGLAIVKKCVDRHKGEIVVTSEIEVGSKFLVTLPLGDCN